MYSAVIFGSNGGLYVGTNVNGKTAHDTVAEAKKAAENYLSTNKTTFQNGYEVFILDRDNGTCVSHAAVEAPSLKWKDHTATDVKSKS